MRHKKKKAFTPEEDDEDRLVFLRRVRDENMTFAMLASSLDSAVRDQIIGNPERDSVEKNAERLEQREECARLTDAVFEMLKREIGGIRERNFDDDSRRSVMLHAEVHNYAANVATFQKSLKLWKKKEMNMVKQLDDETFSNTPQKTAKSPLKKLFVTRAEETDEMLREVERKMERLRVLSSSHDNDAGNRREIGGDIENGRATNKRKFTFAARQNITPKQKRTNQKVLACVVGILFFALFVSTFVWLWTNEAEPWIEKSIRENREHLTYEEIVYEPIDHSNNFDS
jgi:flagellar motility protein MotE (MotC chaperone)